MSLKDSWHVGPSKPPLAKQEGKKAQYQRRSIEPLANTKDNWLNINTGPSKPPLADEKDNWLNSFVGPWRPFLASLKDNWHDGPSKPSLANNSKDNWHNQVGPLPPSLASQKLLPYVASQKDN